MLCRQFLQHLNKSLDPSDQLRSAMLGIEINKTTIKPKAKTTRKMDPLIARRNGLQLICVLGLMYAHISKQSIRELQVTLQLCTATLTDLDLSYSYIGYFGSLVSEFVFLYFCLL